METTISNQYFVSKINHKGAELSGHFRKDVGIEYIWQADPEFWAKSSPVLFPIVGALKQNSFFYNEQLYKLPRHGFARDNVFLLEEKTENKAVFLLKSNDATLKDYPFAFELRIIYTLDDTSLNVAYNVKNAGLEKMYFSLGAHPAFRLPIVNGVSYEDYYLLFNENETAQRWPISNDGLIKTTPQDFLMSTNKLKLEKNLFRDDALVFKDLKSTEISIRSDKNSHGLDFHFKGFPYFGIWAAPNADFVCLEPWCGIADSVNHDQLLPHKEGIQILEHDEQWSRQWSLSCY